ncbi:hypothetical protein VNO77_36213 [Canavalia gladiata]|uniref:Uncharacterized protein n=1 Tax=Canavalia gladiata TaxID=3824 RepID=A0AAN9PWH4_CANGL
MYAWNPSFQDQAAIAIQVHKMGRDRLRMAITIGTTRDLTSIIVIIVLILPEISAQASSSADNVSEPIRHEDNTIRVDPLDNFKKYRGGFNITNKHYLSSVVFTGVYGYAIGVLWLLCGGFFWVTINFCSQSDGGRRTKKILFSSYKICDHLQIHLAILFITLAMVASGMVIAGSTKFHSQAPVKTIIKTVNNITEIIGNATVALEEIRDVLVESNFGAEVAEQLNSTAKKLDTVAKNIIKKTRKNRRIVDKAFKVLFIVTIVVVSMNLIAATTLSVSGVLKFWRVVYLFSNDTCTALDEFEENPYNNSLTSLIPCTELRSAKGILPEIGAKISSLVNEVNSDLSQLPRSLSHVHICDPFSAPPERLYQPENCPPNTIRIGDVPEVLKPYYTCLDDNDKKCDKEPFINEQAYEMAESYSRSIQNLLNMYPSLEHLLGCQIVKDTFSEILLTHCKPLKKFAKMAWLGMVPLAVSVTFLVVLWTINASHEHSHHHSNGSSKPHLTAGNGLELVAAQEIDHK